MKVKKDIEVTFNSAEVDILTEIFVLFNKPVIGHVTIENNRRVVSSNLDVTPDGFKKVELLIEKYNEMIEV
jgi:hypothetical protein